MGIPRKTYIGLTSALYVEKLLPISIDTILIEIAVLFRKSVKGIKNKLGIDRNNTTSAFMNAAIFVLCQNHPFSVDIKRNCFSNI